MFLTAVALFAPIAQANQAVDEAVLMRELGTRMDRVEQFKFIREQAEKLGVKAYLFGGTAAAYAHYVRWDMLRERGDESYLKEFFDYDFFSIYRSTQDLDIVVDGPAKKADELSRIIADKYPILQGDKDAWEIRLLREARGDKLALLGDADFNKQHSDSNSTGLIEITNSREPKVRDLRGWNESSPRFLEDIASGKISYYFSPEHESTTRYRLGKNPPIYSVIRFLTKAFQFDLELRPEDLALIRPIIDSFDPAHPGNGVILNEPDFDYWMFGGGKKVSNAKKLFLHAVDVERAWNVLESLGLRRKLIALGARDKNPDSLATLFKRSPLPSRPLGQGTGKTASELGLDIVAHETRTPMALESITRSKRGWVNAFISRKSADGEAAAHGDGFYTRKGNEGAVGSGLTIRFRLDPLARVGSDFDLPQGTDFVLVHNKRALHVIPESLDCDVKDLFRALVLAGKINLGLIMRLDQRLQTKWTAMTPGERDQADAKIRRDLRAFLLRPNLSTEEIDLLSGWFRLSSSVRYFDEALEFIRRLTKANYGSEFILADSWRKHPRFPELIDTLYARADGTSIMFFSWFRELMKQPDMSNRPEWLKWMTPGPTTPTGAGQGIGELLKDPRFQNDPRWDAIVDKNLADRVEIFSGFGQLERFTNSPRWSEWMDRLLLGGSFVFLGSDTLKSERARKDPKFWKWMYSYAEVALHARTGLAYHVKVWSIPEMPHDQKWIEFGRHILSLPNVLQPSEHDPSANPKPVLNGDLISAQQEVLSAVFKDERILADYVELVLEKETQGLLAYLGWNIFDKGRLPERPDLKERWTRMTKGPSTIERLGSHPVVRKFIPSFMRKPVNCPALFVK